ncbi:uncharacterized protein CLAFUR5_08073 [Fulvia fulva]|uniref:Uncharacterized protein n=1 Tax=Passalora fulva TaxID=5499 RepID=A0A9Q8LD91_PASFU|nr:uncharacterized protein CLAFUR5_08073 [Fulvia fulva]KAK4630724.1 hypothetical protein CLAFUR0_07952 [Fulvia fulva]UJO15244.1 hypothetical protein CLAFUR5_08073 [Fulvia fulva]
MCVIDQKTYVHDGGREEIVEKRHYCHKAVGRTLCRHIERRDLGVVRTVERRPSLSRNIASEPVVTTSRDGRERKMYPLSSLSRRPSKRTSSGQASVTSTASPVDSAASLSSSIPPVYKQVRPEAPMPPPTYKTYPSARQMTPMSPIPPPDPRRTVRPDGTASHDRPPSLEMPRATFIERTPIPRQSSWSSTNADVDQLEDLPPRPSSRRVSFRERRPSISIDIDAATNHYPSRAGASSPGLSHLPKISTTSKGHARVDSVRDEGDQARREQARLSGTDHRQRARLSRDAEQAVRQRAEALQRERDASSSSSRERRERNRREPQNALEGTPVPLPRQSDAMQRRIDAEMAQIAREQREAEERRRREASPSSTSGRSYTFPPSSPLSARRSSNLPVAVHHYRPGSSSKGGDAIAERGKEVIERYARASAELQQMSEAMAYMELRAEEGDEVDEEEGYELRSGGRDERRVRRGGDGRERGGDGGYYQ